MRAIVDSCRRGRSRRTQCAGRIAVISLAVCVLALVSYSLACMLPASIHGRVTDAGTGDPLQQTLVDCLPTPGEVLTDSNGDYVFSDLEPDDYTVAVPITLGSGYVPPVPVDVTLDYGDDVTIDFALERTPVDLSVDVLAPSGTIGDKVTVHCKMRWQDPCYVPTKFWLWAWDTVADKACMIEAIEENFDWTAYADMDTLTFIAGSLCTWEVEFEFEWDTRGVQNGPFELKAAMECGNPHDPANPLQCGTPPPDQFTDGAAGGAIANVAVMNVVIVAYSSSPGTQDFLKYDSFGPAPLDAPEVTVVIDNWQNEPMQIVVWLAATAWGDTRPMTWCDPYIEANVPGPGIYVLAWDGSNPGYWGPGEAEWGTYSYDIDVCKPDDCFIAKTHDGSSDHYASVFGDHDVWWHEPELPDPIEFRCNYTLLNAHDSVEPTDVTLQTLFFLTDMGTLSGQPTALNVLHGGPTGGAGITTFSSTNHDAKYGVWRVVFTGQTGSGAELRRDRANPRMLATNKRKDQWVVKINKPVGSSFSDDNRSTSWRTSSPSCWDFQVVSDASPAQPSPPLEVQGEMKPGYSTYCYLWTLWNDDNTMAGAYAGTVTGDTATPTYDAPADGPKPVPSKYWLQLNPRRGTRIVYVQTARKGIAIYKDHLARDYHNFGADQSSDASTQPKSTPFGPGPTSHWNCYGSVIHAYNGSGMGDEPKTDLMGLLATEFTEICSETETGGMRWTRVTQYLPQGASRHRVVVFYQKVGSLWVVQHAHISRGSSDEMWGANNNPFTFEQRFYECTSQQYYEGYNATWGPPQKLHGVTVHKPKP